MAARKQIDVDGLKRAAAGRWREILAAHGFPSELLDGGHHPCPKCGGQDRFRFTDLDRGGAVLCNQCFCEKNGDGIAALQWLRGWTYPETLHHLADRLGLVSRNGHANGRHPADPEKHLEFRKWNERLVRMLFALKKPGVTAAALAAFGARLARYREDHRVIALPVRSPAPAVVGWCLWELSGGKLPAYHGPGKPVTWEKMLLTAGSKPGLIAPDDFFDQAKRPRRKWKLEGPSDALAAWSAVPAEERGGVFTNSNGARQNVAKEWLSLAAGGELVVIHDADEPGEEGAAKWVKACAPLPDTIVRNPKLPYAVEKTHGKDLRDWLNEGHTSAELLAMAGAAPPIGAESLPPAPIESDDDPHRLARLWLAKQDAPVIYWRCDYYRWSGMCYRRLPDEQLQSELGATIKTEFDRLNLLDQSDAKGNGKPPAARHVTSTTIGNARLAVNSLTCVSSEKEPPQWL